MNTNPRRLLACLLLLAALPAQSPTSGARQPSVADLRYLHSLPMPAVTIADVTVNLNGVPTDIGDIDVVAAPDATNQYTIMDATFRLTRPGLHNWLTFHWVQSITADACPVTYMGRRLPFPQLDPPLNGWDYMYLDGAARTLPDTRIPDFGWFLDDKPWYHNATGEAANSSPGVSYSTRDVPFQWASGGATSFTTWLVAKAPGQSMCLIRGFTWTISRNAALRAGPTDAGPPGMADVGVVNAAMTNAGFVGWSSGAGCDHQLGFDTTVSVDPLARTIGFVLQAIGPPRGLGAMFIASGVNPPFATPFGQLYLDLASMTLLTMLPLNAAGFGELRASVPAASYADFAVQVAVTNGIDLQLTNYALFGTYANALQTEILAARYDGARDVFSVTCKGTPGDSLEVMLANGLALPRSLGMFTVPPAPTMITFTHTEPAFRAGMTFEVWNRTRRVRLIQMH